MEMTRGGLERIDEAEPRCPQQIKRLKLHFRMFYHYTDKTKYFITYMKSLLFSKLIIGVTTTIAFTCEIIMP